MDGVEGGAFAELVTADEEVEASAVGLTGILADAAYQAVVLTRSVDGHGEPAAFGVVDHPNPGGRGEDFARFLGGHGSVEGQVDRRAVGPQYRHALPIPGYQDEWTSFGMLPTDYSKVFEPMGAYTERVEDPAKLKPALERAFKSGKTAVIDCLVDRTIFHPIQARRGLEVTPESGPFASFWDPEDPTTSGSLDRGGTGNILTTNKPMSYHAHLQRFEHSMIEVSKWEGQS